MIKAIMVRTGEKKAGKEDEGPLSIYECFMQEHSRKIRFTIEDALWKEHGFDSVPNEVEFTMAKKEG